MVESYKPLIFDDYASSIGIDELNLIIDHAPCHLTIKTKRALESRRIATTLVPKRCK